MVENHDVVSPLNVKGSRVTPNIENLLRVQELDCRLVRLQRELQDIPVRQKDVESRLSGCREAVAKAKAELKVRQAAVHQLEGDVEAQKERIRKLREQQMQLKSNKDFKTMDLEVDGVQKFIRTIEEKALAAMEAVDGGHQELKRREAELRVEEDGLQADVQTLDQRGKTIQTEVTQLAEERQGLSETVAPEWLKYYDRLFQNKKDKVLVSTENGICGGCHLRLPPYLPHEARKQSEVVTCSYCGRMLYST